jgi:transcriptional regulator with XRE-family HTH domain
MNQTDLAVRLGVTFQQIQKYEKGVNRVAAARLLDIATVLTAPIDYFFDAEDAPGLVAMSEARDLAILYACLSPRQRRRALWIVRTVAEK